VEGVHATAEVAGDAKVVRSVLGAGVVVGAGAEVRDAVLLPGAHVGPGAVIDRAVLGRDVEVGADARIDDLAVLGDQAVVAAGLRVSGGSVGVGEHLDAGS
jgi:mannose-1-phosphate guanylyltransferase